MNFSDFQKAALRSYKDGSLEPLTSKTTMALLGAMGMAGETGECTEPVKKWFFHRKGTFESVRAKLKEEIGDVLWYCALLAKAFDLDLQEIADNNIAKLLIRYPDSPQDSPQKER